jgi:hypothetical protein
LILERILIPGIDHSNEGWPFISVTDHGWQVVQAEGPIPYDPEGYLARVRGYAIHSTALRYLEEAVSTFRSGNYLASAVMLGAASERVFSDVVASIAQTISDQGKRSSFIAKAQAGKMADRVRTVVGWCRNHKSDLAGEWREDDQIEVIDQ